MVEFFWKSCWLTASKFAEVERHDVFLVITDKYFNWMKKSYIIKIFLLEGKFILIGWKYILISYKYILLNRNIFWYHIKIVFATFQQPYLTIFIIFVIFDNGSYETYVQEKIAKYENYFFVGQRIEEEGRRKFCHICNWKCCWSCTVERMGQWASRPEAILHFFVSRSKS